MLHYLAKTHSAILHFLFDNASRNPSVPRSKPTISNCLDFPKFVSCMTRGKNVVYLSFKFFTHETICILLFLGFPSFSIRGFLPVFDNLVLFSVSESACMLYRKYHYNHSYPRTLTLTCDGVSIWSLKRRTNSNWWICLRIFVLCFQEQKTYEQIKAEIMASNGVEDD